MTILHFYLIFSAVTVLLSNNFFPVFREDYSWWLVPVLFLAIFIGLILIQLLLLLFSILTSSLKKPPSKAGEKFFRFLLKHSLPIIMFVAKIKVNHKGTEKMPEDGRVFLVCNHQQDLDPAIILSCFLNRDLSFIGKKDIIEEMPFIAKAMHRFSCLFIDRDNDREGAKTIVKAIKQIKEDRCSIALFPEGYCSKDDQLQPLRNGSLKIALKTKVPVVVCVIDKTKLLPKNVLRRKTTIDFRVVDVIYPETYENMNTLELGNLIYSKMDEGLKEIRNIQQNL